MRQHRRKRPHRRPVSPPSQSALPAVSWALRWEQERDQQDDALMRMAGPVSDRPRKARQRKQKIA